MSIRDPRLDQLKTIKQVMKANTGGIQNAHPFLKPLWLEVERLEAQLETCNQCEQSPLKSASELLAEKTGEKKSTEKESTTKKLKSDETKKS